MIYESENLTIGYNSLFYEGTYSANVLPQLFIAISKERISINLDWLNFYILYSYERKQNDN